MVVRFPVSYIVAYVIFETGALDYPVNCWIENIKPGDRVVVRMNTRAGDLKVATVTTVAFLNWNCTNSIMCRLENATFDDDRMIRLTSDRPAIEGLTMPAQALKILAGASWQGGVITNRRHYRTGCWVLNSTHKAELFFRINGVDLQVSRSEAANTGQHSKKMMTFYSSLVRFDSETQCGSVRYNFSHSGRNVLRHIIDFSNDFCADKGDYANYMIALGKRDRRRQIDAGCTQFD